MDEFPVLLFDRTGKETLEVLLRKAAESSPNTGVIFYRFCNIESRVDSLNFDFSQEVLPSTIMSLARRLYLWNPKA